MVKKEAAKNKAGVIKTNANSAKDWKQHFKALMVLLILQLLIDLLFVYLYPAVNPWRATMIGATAFVVLWIPFLQKQVGLHPTLAFLPVFVNALLGALAVQAGIVASKSATSGLLHAVILIVTYGIIVKFKK